MTICLGAGPPIISRCTCVTMCRVAIVPSRQVRHRLVGVGDRLMYDRLERIVAIDDVHQEPSIWSRFMRAEPPNAERPMCPRFPIMLNGLRKVEELRAFSAQSVFSAQGIDGVHLNAMMAFS